MNETDLWQIANVLFLDLQVRKTWNEEDWKWKHKYSLRTTNALQDMKWGIRRKCISAISEIYWELKELPWVCANTMTISKLPSSLSALLNLPVSVICIQGTVKQGRCTRGICSSFLSLGPWQVKGGQPNPSYKRRLAYSLDLQGICKLWL